MREGADFQTPPAVCEFMAGLIPEGVITILEPTPGAGNLVRAIESKGRYQVTAPENYFTLDKAARFDCIVMNRPLALRQLTEYLRATKSPECGSGILFFRNACSGVTT